MSAAVWDDENWLREHTGTEKAEGVGSIDEFTSKMRARVGLNDAYRNCISNVRLAGLSYGMATFRLMYLMREACRRQLSGVDLKDEAEVPTLDNAGPGNFLLPDQR